MKNLRFMTAAAVLFLLEFFLLPLAGLQTGVYLFPLLFLAAVLLEKKSELNVTLSVFLLLFLDLWSGTVWGLATLSTLLTMSIIILLKEHLSLQHRHPLFSFWWLLASYYLFAVIYPWLEKMIRQFKGEMALDWEMAAESIFRPAGFIQIVTAVFLMLIIYQYLIMVRPAKQKPSFMAGKFNL